MSYLLDLTKVQSYYIYWTTLILQYWIVQITLFLSNSISLTKTNHKVDVRYIIFSKENISFFIHLTITRVYWREQFLSSGVSFFPIKLASVITCLIEMWYKIGYRFQTLKTYIYIYVTKDLVRYDKIELTLNISTCVYKSNTVFKIL